jgi:hypothetical protein
MRIKLFYNSSFSPDRVFLKENLKDYGPHNHDWRLVIGTNLDDLIKWRDIHWFDKKPIEPKDVGGLSFVYEIDDTEFALLLLTYS